jgi:hypothetical protein
MSSDCETKQADVVVNARVATAPELLQQMTEDAVKAACQEVGAACDIRQSQSFRPGRPEPTYRVDDTLTSL